MDLDAGGSDRRAGAIAARDASAPDLPIENEPTMKTTILAACMAALTATGARAVPNDPSLTQRTAAVREMASARALPPLDAPWFDTTADGALWVRGADYKASFDASGATYYPIFGSDTPRHFPLRMSLAAARGGAVSIALAPGSAPVRDGDRVTIDRGAIDEVYEIGLRGIEQTFVVESRPQGDLRLTVAIETELAASETADGFVYANEHGAVRYGRAFVREPDGTKRAMPTRRVAGGVEIEVDAAYLATAEFPLVVDPFVGQFGMTQTTLHQQFADIAYDAGANTFLLAFEEVVAASDRDVRTITIDYTGSNIVTTSYVDTSVQDWEKPSVGNLRSTSQFLVASCVSSYPGFTTPGSQFRVVVARGCSASSPSSWSAPTLVTPASEGLTNRYDVSVGGDDAASGTSSFLLAWEDASSSDSKIYTRRVDSSFAPIGGVASVSSATNCLRPSVSKYNNHSRWNVVWEQAGDVWGAQVSATTGNGVTGPFAIASSALYEAAPAAASPFADGSWACVWQQNTPGGERDLYCKVFNGSTLVAERNVSASHASTQTLEQRMPAIDCDGERIAIAYAEEKSAGSSDFDVYVDAYFSIGGILHPSEIHAPIATSSLPHIEPAIVSTNAAGEAGRRFGLAYTVLATQTADMFGALYDLPEGGSTSVICPGDGTATACPCGNVAGAGRGCPNSLNASGALLAATGIASLANDTLVLSGSGMNNNSVLYFQGTNQPGSGVAFGDGVRCTVGTIVRLGIKLNSAGASSVPSGGDAKISAMGQLTAPTTRTYQAWYRDPQSFCTVNTFNLTNGIFIVWSL